MSPFLLSANPVLEKRKPQIDEFYEGKSCLSQIMEPRKPEFRNSRMVISNLTSKNIHFFELDLGT